MWLVIATLGLAPMAPAISQTAPHEIITGLYARMDAAMGKKEPRGALAAFAPDWIGTQTLNGTTIQVNETQYQFYVSFLLASAKTVQAHTKPETISIHGGTALIRIASHLVWTVPTTGGKPDWTEWRSDEVRDDTWIRGTAGWKIARSRTISATTIGLQHEIVIEPLPDTQKEQDAGVRILSGHKGRVNTLAFSPDGTALASGGDDKTVRIWDVHIGRPIRRLRGEQGAVQALAYSPDGTMLAVGTGRDFGSKRQDGRIFVWNVRSGQLVRVLPVPGSRVRVVAFSPDGRQIAGGSYDGSVLIWNAATGQLLRTIFRSHDKYPEAVDGIVFLSKGRVLAACYFAEIRRWDMDRETALPPIRTIGTTMAISPDEQTVASGGQTLDDSEVDLNDYATGEVSLYDSGTARWFRNLRWPQANGGVVSMAFSPDGLTLAAATPDEIKLWDWKTGKVKRTLLGRYGIQAIAFSPDGKLLASEDDEGHVRLQSVTPAR